MIIISTDGPLKLRLTPAPETLQGTNSLLCIRFLTTFEFNFLGLWHSNPHTTWLQRGTVKQNVFYKWRSRTGMWLEYQDNFHVGWMQLTRPHNSYTDPGRKFLWVYVSCRPIDVVFFYSMTSLTNWNRTRVEWITKLVPIVIMFSAQGTHGPLTQVYIFKKHPETPIIDFHFLGRT